MVDIYEGRQVYKVQEEPIKIWPEARTAWLMVLRNPKVQAE